METNRLTMLLLALAAFRAYAYLRHQELADLAATLGFVLLACGEYRRLPSDVPTRPDGFGATAYTAGVILIGVAVVLMLIPGG